MKNEEQGLEAKIIDGKLVVSIGLDVLAYAVEQASDYDPDFLPVKVINKMNFAKDIIEELTLEDEGGRSSITELIDAAAMSAIENGSEWVEEVEG